MNDSTPQLSFFKVCTACGQSKLLSEYHKFGTGLRPTCKACTNAQNRGIYRKNHESHLESKRRYRRENPETRAKTLRQYANGHIDKRKAHDAVGLAIRNKKIPPASECTCSHCSNPAETYHHWSYELEHWLDVIPLCRECHGKEHRVHVA